LKKHDVIKLGRVKFKVKEIRVKDLEKDINRQKRKKRRLREIDRLKQEAARLGIGFLELCKEEGKDLEQLGDDIEESESNFEGLEGEENYKVIEAVPETVKPKPPQ
jgi:hypothetical protein